VKSRVFGGKCGGLLASYHKDEKNQLWYWKTSQISFDWGEERFLEALPKSGIMQSGQLSAQVILGPVIEEKGGFVLPTPTASDSWNIRDSRKRFNRKGTKDYNIKKSKNPSCQNLHTAVTHMLPTPTAKANQAAPSFRHHWKGFLPTPTSLVYKNNPSTPSAWNQNADLNTEIAKMEGHTQETIGKKARLNPHFVTWMMGFPTGWLD